MNGTSQTLKGRYEIERPLGRGGMSAVYLARDLELLSKRVVVKVLLDDTSQDPWVRQKFLQEMEALARIDHPGVVGVLDTGLTPEGKQFLVMQYIEGDTLRSAIRPGGMEFARAAGIIRQVGQALGAAHEKGVWHRDLKPENIMLQRAGGEDYAKLIDFGIAGIQDSRFSGEKTKVAGTLTYMAPEQMAGNACAATDTYALGVVAYEMLTGEPPFPENSMMHLASEEKASCRPPAQLRPELPDAAGRAILKAMSFRPEARHASIRDFSEELSRSLALRTAPTEYLPKPESRPVEQPKRRGIVFAAAAALALAAGGGGWFLLHSPGQELHLNYFITVQKTRDGQPFGQPFRLPGEMLFEQGYKIALNIANPQAGYLYILDDGPNEAGQRVLRLLEPRGSDTAQRPAAATMRIPPAGNWLQFDAATGKEILYLVWATEPVSALDQLRSQPDVPADSARFTELQSFLQSHPSEAFKNDQAGQTELRTREKVLVHGISLQHQ